MKAASDLCSSRREEALIQSRITHDASRMDQSLLTSAAAVATGQFTSRSALALARIQLAQDALADCHLCAHHCGVNRHNGERGLCHAGAEAGIFSAQVEVSDELELIPVFAIAFSGCDFRCDFCITGAESWNPRAGQLLQGLEHSRRRHGLRQSIAAVQNLSAQSTSDIAARAKSALAKGARSIMVLGGEPTIHLPAVLELVATLPDDAKLVWKTNAHGSAQARALLDGLFDVWLADYKFGNDTCALRLSRTPDYTRVVRENLVWVAREEGFTHFAKCVTSSHSSPVAAGRSDHADRAISNALGTGSIVASGDGRGASVRTHFAKCVICSGYSCELIVRHLLMPGHVECCWRPVAEWLASELPGVKVNLRSGFWPAWQAARHPELRRTTSDAETERALALAHELGLNLIE
jgi:putative pyruvate formate lyase activating enzyme